MQLEQGFSLAASPDVAWQAFHDLTLLVDCLPGASIPPGAAPPVPGADMPLLFQVRLGPIAAGFAGQGRITLDEASRSGSFAGSAVDAKTNSRVKGEARFLLQPEGAGVRVALSVDYTITGALAQFSREGIVRALAEQLTRQFADNLQTRLPQASDPAAATLGLAGDAEADRTAERCATASAVGMPASMPAGGRAGTPTDTSSIDLWSLLRAWLRDLFGRHRA